MLSSHKPQISLSACCSTWWSSCSSSPGTPSWTRSCSGPAPGLGPAPGVGSGPSLGPGPGLGPGLGPGSGPGPCPGPVLGPGPALGPAPGLGPRPSFGPGPNLGPGSDLDPVPFFNCALLLLSRSLKNIQISLIHFNTPGGQHHYNCHR